MCNSIDLIVIYVDTPAFHGVVIYVDTASIRPRFKAVCVRRRNVVVIRLHLLITLSYMLFIDAYEVRPGELVIVARCES